MRHAAEATARTARQSWVAAASGAARQLSTAAAMTTQKPPATILPIEVLNNLGYERTAVPSLPQLELLARKGGYRLIPQGKSLLVYPDAKPFSQTELDATIARFNQLGIYDIVYDAKFIGNEYKGLAASAEVLARSYSEHVLMHQPYAVYPLTGEGGPSHFTDWLNQWGFRSPGVKVFCTGFSYQTHNPPRGTDIVTLNLTQAVYPATLLDRSKPHCLMQDHVLQYGSFCHLKGITPMLADRLPPDVVEGRFIGGNLSVIIADSGKEAWRSLEGDIIYGEDFDATEHLDMREVDFLLRMAHERGAVAVIIGDQRLTYLDARRQKDVPRDEIKKGTQAALERTVAEFFKLHPESKLAVYQYPLLGHGVNAPVGLGKKICIIPGPNGTYQAVIDSTRDLGAKELIAAGAQITEPEPQVMSFAQIMLERQKQLGLTGGNRRSSL